MEFAERKVLILVNSKPFGRIVAFEGWRAAVGMFGMDHESQMLFTGDGVYGLIKDQDIMAIKMFKSTFESFDGIVYASKKSLEERNIDASEIFETVEVIEEADVANRLVENEVIITF